MTELAVRTLALLVIAACGGTRPAPPPPAPEAPVVTAPRHERARRDYPVPQSPMALAVAAGSIVWTDIAGSIWTMPVNGGAPKELANQHDHTFSFHPVVAGTRVLVTTKGDLHAVALPAGPVTRLGANLPDMPVAAVADDRAVYVTLFKRTDVMRVPADGGPPRKLFDVPRGVLALHDATLYAASYTTGALVAIPTAGGTPRTVARGLVRPTALAADDRDAFVYTERDRTLRRIALATGEMTVLATGLENSDDVVEDGEYVYTYTWGARGKLLRIPKAGGEPVVLADDLKSPHGIFIDADSVWIASRDQNLIVRIGK